MTYPLGYSSMNDYTCSHCGKTTGGYRVHNGTEPHRGDVVTTGNGKVYPRIHGGCPGENIAVAPALVGS